MALKVAFQMDPIERIDIRGDSTFALLLEAQWRGHDVFYYTPHNLSLSDGKLIAEGHSLTVEDRPGAKVAVQAILEPGGEWAKLIVLDNGPGIPDDQHEDIFRPFVSTKGSRGTGLGLPVSRKILREHGGDIHVQSVMDKGSKFTLRIPMKTDFGSDHSGGTHIHPILDAPPGE